MATRKEINDKVMVKLDEMTNFEEDLIISSGNDGVLPISDYIESILNECTKEHLKVCPLHKIPSTNIATLTSPSVSSSIVTFAKSDNADFVKINSIQLTGWKRAVHKAITTDNPMYKLQGNSYTRGGNAKPVVVELANKIECYTSSVTTGDYDYVKYTVPESITDEATLDMIAWLCASKVLAIMKDQATELAKKNYIELLNS